jgi:hypothetical protein
MNRLLSIGFEHIGNWRIINEMLNFVIERHGTQANILYAFVCDGEVMYIGKTIQKLSLRMQGYKTPGVNQPTNLRNNKRIIERLNNNEAVKIYALPDNGLMHYGGFHLNMAAALEDDLIRQIEPVWNGGEKEIIKSSVNDEETNFLIEEIISPIDVFTLTIGPTYFNKGFFNVPVAHQGYFGDDRQKIELFVSDISQPITGTIDRKANTNGSPRIIGGAALRDLIRSKWNLFDEIQVDVLSPTSLRLR